MSETAFVFNIVRGSFCDGYGTRTTVFLKGCPLRCLWCCNIEGQKSTNEMMVSSNLCDGCGECVKVCSENAISIESSSTEFNIRLNRSICTCCGKCQNVCINDAIGVFAKEYTVDELFDVVRKDEYHYRLTGGGVTIGGGEATMNDKFTYAFMKKCQNYGINVAIDTCGYTVTELGFQCLVEADLLLYDLKHMDSAKHKELTGVSNERILDNLRLLNDMRQHIIIRIPVIPGYNDTDGNLEHCANFIAELKSVERVDLIGYHNYSSKKYTQLGLAYPLSMPAATEEYMNKIIKIFQSRGIPVQLGG